MCDLFSCAYSSSPSTSVLLSWCDFYHLHAVCAFCLHVMIFCFLLDAVKFGSRIEHFNNFVLTERGRKSIEIQRQKTRNQRKSCWHLNCHMHCRNWNQEWMNKASKIVELRHLKFEIRIGIRLGWLVKRQTEFTLHWSINQHTWVTSKHTYISYSHIHLIQMLKTIEINSLLQTLCYMHTSVWFIYIDFLLYVYSGSRICAGAGRGTCTLHMSFIVQLKNELILFCELAFQTEL